MYDSLLTLLRNAPVLILYGCVFLFILWALFVYRLWWEVRKVKQDINALASTLEEFGETSPLERRDGLTLGRLDQLRVAGANLSTSAGGWWRRIEGHIEQYVSAEEKEGWFLTESPRSILPYEVVVSRDFNATRYSSFPGILTGAGLMLTFVAILLGLLGVHYDKSNTIEPITGIDTLINGLSGKFLSSILALFLSIVFTFIEQYHVRQLRQSYERLLFTVANSIPYLHGIRILLDIHRFSSKQAVSVSNISAEVVDRLTNAFNDRVVPGLATGMSDGFAGKLQAEFRPTMERMASSLDGLQGAITRLESEKQQSVTGEFEKMAQALEQSITRALENMATGFHDALSGSAKQEFGNVQGTLEATRAMLSDMNGQFGAMQAAFSEIVKRAEETTTGQLNSGREQTEALTRLMHGLMDQLGRAANQNLQDMQSNLTRVVGDLTDKVTGLSVDMMDAAKSMANHSQQSASQIIEKTDAWSEATAKRLESLLANIESRSEDFKHASTSLLEAKTFMSSLLAQNANALAQMVEASGSVKAYSLGLVGHSDTLKGLSADHNRASTQLMAAADSLRTVVGQNEKLLGDYRHATEEYERLLGTLDQSIAKVMSATSKGLSDYNQSVERNFTKICEIANEMVPKAANLLNTQVSDLGEQLDALQDVLADTNAAIAKSVERANGRA